MTNEKQNIAIAVACGWTNVVERISRFGPQEIPSYTTDLNAMHEAEKMFTGSQDKEYVNNLDWVSERLDGAVFSTAAQRAEAFLRAIGKWEGGE